MAIIIMYQYVKTINSIVTKYQTNIYNFIKKVYLTWSLHDFKAIVDLWKSDYIKRNVISN